MAHHGEAQRPGPRRAASRAQPSSTSIAFLDADRPHHQGRAPRRRASGDGRGCGRLGRLHPPTASICGRDGMGNCRRIRAATSSHDTDNPACPPQQPLSECRRNPRTVTSSPYRDPRSAMHSSHSSGDKRFAAIPVAAAGQADAGAPMAVIVDVQRRTAHRARRAACSPTGRGGADGGFPPPPPPPPAARRPGSSSSPGRVKRRLGRRRASSPEPSASRHIPRRLLLRGQHDRAAGPIAAMAAHALRHVPGHAAAGIMRDQGHRRAVRWRLQARAGGRCGGARQQRFGGERRGRRTRS